MHYQRVRRPIGGDLIDMSIYLALKKENERVQGGESGVQMHRRNKEPGCNLMSE